MPGGSGIFTSWPRAEVCLATTTPLASVTATLPAPVTGGGREQCGRENRVSGPRTMKKPETSSVGPAVTSGSWTAGGYAAVPEQNGLSRTVTVTERLPAAGDWRAIVWTAACVTAAPVLWRRQPARV